LRDEAVIGMALGHGAPLNFSWLQGFR